MQNLKGRNLVTLHDWTTEEILQVLNLGLSLKEKKYSNEKHEVLEGKTLAMIFEKPSLRTRVSFEIGMKELGGYGIYLGPNDIKLGKRETTEDIAKVTSSYVDLVMARTFKHETIKDIAKYSSVPVINGLCEYAHPCQALADYMTILEKKGTLKGLNLLYIGDGNNVAHSLMFAGAKLGVNVTLAVPEGYEPNERAMKEALEDAAKTGVEIKVVHNAHDVIADIDVLYTDVWTSMGQEDEAEERRRIFKNFQINMDLLNKAKKDAIVLHCLPAHYDEEITHDVSVDPRSAIFTQAENRKHAQKALMASICQR